MANKPKQKELGGTRNMSTGTKVVIGVFAVVMALSMMLPSLTSIFAGAGAAQEEEEQAEAANETEGNDTIANETEVGEGNETEVNETAAREAKALEGVPDNESLQDLAKTNYEKVEPLEERLKEEPENLAVLLNLGNAYMNWGYSAKYSGTTDEEQDYAKGLLQKAISYYDDYLKLNDSNAVKVDRALCQYYMGDTDKAIESLEKIAKDNPDFPLAWANLGMLYEQQGDSEKASDAYRKAIESDKDDEYGAKSYANSRLISLNSKVDSPSDAGEADANNLVDKSDSGLTSTLNEKVGLDL